LEFPKVAVLVLNFNGKRHLENCFSSLKSQSYPRYDVYLVDNASSDDSIDYVRRNLPFVKVIALEKNYGFAEAYNKAIQSVDFEYVALLNNDTSVHYDWLMELVKAILHDDRIVACGSKILFDRDTSKVNHAGGKLTPLGGGFDIGLFEKDSELYSRMRYVGCVCGAAMLIRTKVFLIIGGFDSDFFAYFEDVDFCWRAWLYGLKILYVPSSVVYHKFGGTWGSKISPKRMFLGERNRLLTAFKNLNGSNLAKALATSIFFNAARVISLLRTRRYKSALSILAGDQWIAQNLGILLRKRRIVQSRRIVSDELLMKRDLIASLLEGFAEFQRLRTVC